ncbi:hypothetical protein P3T29_006318 [Kitasatospora sp. MAP5-34]|nr:hypothetical protein [Kitasatospora sp. MAP5-34]
MLSRFGRNLHTLAGDGEHTRLWDQYTNDTRRNRS